MPSDIYDSVTVHYSEIALKGQNRPAFEGALEGNAYATISDLASARVHRRSGRLLVTVPPENVEEAMDRLRSVLGVAWLSPCVRAGHDVGELKDKAVLVARNCSGGADTFKVEATRADKGFPLSSLEINEEIGGAVVDALGLRVNLDRPGFRIIVEILKDEALVCCDKVRGFGGLPVGTTGEALALLSGGIDSPVAAWLIAKRGAAVDLLHLYPFDSFDEAELDGIIRLARALTKYTLRTRLFLAPCWPVRYRVTRREGRYASLLFRLFSLKLAARLAGDRGYAAAITGDSVGQVASQTLHNISAVYSNAGVAVLAPLLGMDKEEIVRLAKSIGTYDISIEPYPDCCPAMVGRRVATRITPEALAELYEGAGLDAGLDEAVGELREIAFVRRGSEILRVE